MNTSRQHPDWVSLELKHELNALLEAAGSKDVDAYRATMRRIGTALGEEIDRRLPNECEVVLACTVEDADFLAKGVLDRLERRHRVHLACYWNERIKDERGSIAPILARYEEPIEERKIAAVVVVKSIISGACVVRTNLVEVLDKVHHAVPVFVAAPVMYRDAPSTLAASFPRNISRRFEYLPAAIDDEKDGEVIRPGIGGMVYGLLGLGDEHAKNKHRPRVVAFRSDALETRARLRG